MADFNLKYEKHFQISLNNPFPEILRQHTQFLRHWLRYVNSKNPPTIVLFFEPPPLQDEEYVKDYNKRVLVLNKEAFENPKEVVCGILKAYEKTEIGWEMLREAWRLEKIKQFSELMFPPKPDLHLVK